MEISNRVNTEGICHVILFHSNLSRFYKEISFHFREFFFLWMNEKGKVSLAACETRLAVLGNREGVAKSHVVAETCDGTSRCANVSDTVNTICHIRGNIPKKINFTATQKRARSTPNESRFPVWKK